ncbi:MAG: NTP transferase domain-containing protein [Burkholderiales bacterium]|nr:NTP transferase domain-containing protein [Burkholderiales bacterium]
MAMVLAGGQGTRLGPLTAACAKPAVPFLYGVRLIDFALANLANSGVRDICVVAQYQPASLVEHLDRVWTPWADREGVSLSVVLPRVGGDARPFSGTADAVRQNMHLIEARGAGLVAVFAADHVYRMDVRQMVAFHARCGADVSIAALPVPIRSASALGVIAADEEGRIRDFQEKPARPAAMPGNPSHAFASMGNYLFRREALDGLLAECDPDRDTDFGHHLLPRAVAGRRVFAYDFSTNRVPGLGLHEEHGYWRDVGTVAALRAARRDACGPRPRIDLANPRWPLSPLVPGTAGGLLPRPTAAARHSVSQEA